MEADREGDAAYLGTAQFDLVAAAGGSVEEWSRTTYQINRRFAFPLESLEAGSRSDWSSRRSGNSGDVRLIVGTFDPSAPINFSPTTASGFLRVDIGGTVSPPVGAAGGEYTNTITLTVEYQ